MPWLNRELLSVVPSSPYTTGSLLHSIDELIQNYDMTSRSFRRRVHQYVFQHTDHFIHELVNFARSPFDMIAYDRHVMYTPMFDDDVIVAVSSSDESDLVVATSHPPPTPVVPIATPLIVRNGISLTIDATPAALNQAATDSASGNASRQPVITTGSNVNAATQASTSCAVATTVIDSSSDSSDVIISNEGSAFAALKWRTPLPGSSGQPSSSASDPQARDEPLILYSSSEDESEEVSAYSKNQLVGGPTFTRDGARLSPNTLRKNNSGRTVIVSVNFGGRGSSTATIGETPTPSDAPSGSELNATPAKELAASRTQTTTPPEVAQTVQVVTSDATATTTAIATVVPTPAIQSTSVELVPMKSEPTEENSVATDPANVIEESDDDEVVCVIVILYINRALGNVLIVFFL